jgi:RNA polymerase sigma-70 factor, ECF subfamily
MFEFERYRDRELLQRFRAGDRDAFAEVYGEHSAAVFRFALAMTGDRIKSAEITQDVFVWLIHHPGGFDPERGELGAFLVGVARKLLKRRLSQEQRWVPIEDSIPAPTRESADDYDVELLRLGIAALPERYREAVALCDLESRSYEEAAAIAECAVGTVRSRLHRARALLARKLAGTRKPSGRGCAV